MTTDLYIPKGRTLPGDVDFQFLRAEGLKYIEGLASTLWTDYNTHDPGITILEALCYAITELGYRCDFEMQDLLANKNGKVDTAETFFSAKTIFRNNPLTVEDYRKTLIDIMGVHNAFLFPKQNVDDLSDDEIPKTEVFFYPDCKKDALVYHETHHEAIDVRGLYKVIVDLDTTSEFGDLNIGNVYYSLSSSALIGVNIEAVLPPWREIDINLPDKIIVQSYSHQVNYDAVNEKWNVILNYNDGSSNKIFNYSINKTLNTNVPGADAIITSELDEMATQQSILNLYGKKIQYINLILNQCWQKLHGQRNICEDFISIDTVYYTGIGFCADIETTNEADIEEILGNVYFLIQEYFSPTINFYLLQELIAKGVPTDEIFEGPSSLQHGFIDTEELINAQLRSEIRVSDIINLIMDIPGVVATKNVLLTAYDDKGNIIQSGVKWCLHLDPFHKPVLDIFRSKVLFFKNKLPFKAKLSEVLSVMRLLQATNERPKLQGHRDDLPMPTGSFYQLDDYFTVQYELPQTYGVSPAGLSNEESYQRKAQALQLRAYLLLNDQLLANFFSQLYHAKDLFSLDNSLNKTYFTQYLTEIKDIEKIYRDLQLPQVSNHAFTLEEVLNGPVPVPSDPADPLYQQSVWLNQLHAKLVEDEDSFGDRRNRFLDHLLSRFAESFNNFVFLLYSADKERIAEAELINDKILFLKDYPVISADRGKAFNYLVDSWNTNNVSGLEKRVSRFAGIHDSTQRSLFCWPDYEVINNGTAIDPKFIFHLVNSSGDAVLQSVREYNTIEETENVLNKLYENILNKNSYKIIEVSSAKFEIQLFDEGGQQVAVSEKTFPGENDAETYLDEMIKDSAPACDAEGMHLVEHVLLRPYFRPDSVPVPENDCRVMQVCLGKDCNFCGEEDPYSFRISVYIPFWPARFRDMDLRKYIEDLFEKEAPAHIAVKVCWLNYTSMKKFEKIYQEWLIALKNYGADIKKDDDTKKQSLKEASNKMVEFMATVHSEYPEARLHDCETSVTNPVRLGNTVLGSF